MFENKKIATTMNIIFFLPLFIINFFFYGIDGDIRLIKEIRKNIKTLDKNKTSAIIKSSKERRIKAMTREEMLTEVVRTKGFEDKWTIWFAELVENETVSDSTLQDAMVAAITMPFDDEDEDE